MIIWGGFSFGWFGTTLRYFFIISYIDIKDNFMFIDFYYINGYKELYKLKHKIKKY